MNKASFRPCLAGVALAIVGCQDASETETQPIALRLPAISAEASLQETRDRVKDAVADPDSVAALLDALANARDELREGDLQAARARIYDFIRRLEGLVDDGDIPRSLGDELLLYAGDNLSAIGFGRRCAPTPGSNPPANLYSSDVVCVARLPADPADPDTPLPPDSREHCNPVAKVLLQQLVDKALTACRANPYGCAPIPGQCQTTCGKSAQPGFTIPRVTFTPDSANCDDEPIKKHSCAAIGFYYCDCSCLQVEDS